MGSICFAKTTKSGTGTLVSSKRTTCFALLQNFLRTTTAVISGRKCFACSAPACEDAQPSHRVTSLNQAAVLSYARALFSDIYSLRLDHVL